MIKNNGALLYNPLIPQQVVKPTWTDVVNSLPNKWSWWHFDEPVVTNTHFADATGQGRELQMGNVSVAQASGLIKNYSNLARHRGQFGSPCTEPGTPGTPMLGSAPFSFVIAVNSDARILATKQQCILGFGQVAVNGMCEFFTNGGFPSVISNGTSIQSASSIVAGTVYLFIFTFDGTTGKLYQATYASAPVVVCSGALTFNIAAGGTYWGPANVLVNDILEGVFDEGIFTTDVITQANIQALYNAFAGK